MICGTKFFVLWHILKMNHSVRNVRKLFIGKYAHRKYKGSLSDRSGTARASGGLPAAGCVNPTGRIPGCSNPAGRIPGCGNSARRISGCGNPAGRIPGYGNSARPAIGSGNSIGQAAGSGKGRAYSWPLNTKSILLPHQEMNTSRAEAGCFLVLLFLIEGMKRNDVPRHPNLHSVRDVA